MTVILDLPFAYSVWISSAVAIIYTLLGGLYSVAYTDVIQLGLIFFSLVSRRSKGSCLMSSGLHLDDVTCLPAVVVCPLPAAQPCVREHR